MELTVHTATPYQIVIQRGCLSQIGPRAAQLFGTGKRTVVVGDTNTIPLYGKTVVAVSYTHLDVYKRQP